MSAKNNYRKGESNISQGRNEGSPFYTFGAKVGYIGIPDGMAASKITFEGSFDGMTFFPILNESGRPLVLTSSPALADAQAKPYPFAPIPYNVKVYPVPGNLTEGIQFIRAISDKAETESRAVEFYTISKE